MILNTKSAQISLFEALPMHLIKWDSLVGCGAGVVLAVLIQAVTTCYQSY